MRFGLPKPIHGWRALLGEIGIIVVGVLIALGAQQWAEQREWDHRAALANEAIKAEVGHAALMGYERQAIQPCLQGKIRELADKLDRSDGQWAASPMAVKNAQYYNVMPVAYRSPSRVFFSDAWATAISDGTLNHLPAARVEDYSGLYNQLTHMRALQEEEQKAAASLTPLSYDGRIDDRMRAEMLARLAEVDRINSLMALVGEQIIAAVRELHLEYPKDEIAKEVQNILTEQRGNRGSCVKASPLDLG
jgi:hypothetical protein